MFIQVTSSNLQILLILILFTTDLLTFLASFISELDLVSTMRFQPFRFTALWASVAFAQQFPSSTPRNITSVTSELFQGAEISFKKVSMRVHENGL